jgi:hypothetical protein
VALQHYGLLFFYYGRQEPGYFQGLRETSRDARNDQFRPAALLLVYVTILSELRGLYNLERLNYSERRIMRIRYIFMRKEEQRAPGPRTYLYLPGTEHK